MLAPVNVLAQCITLGTVVNCTGSTPSPGFGDGTQNGLTINVENGATVSGGSPNWLAALELGSNNVVNNFGSVVGNRHGIFSSGVNVENSGSITGLYGIWNNSGNFSLSNSGYIYGSISGAAIIGVGVTNIITNTALGHIAGQLYGINGDGATINKFMSSWQTETRRSQIRSPRFFIFACSSGSAPLSTSFQRKAQRILLLGDPQASIRRALPESLPLGASMFT